MSGPVETALTVPLQPDLTSGDSTPGPSALVSPSSRAAHPLSHCNQLTQDGRPNGAGEQELGLGLPLPGQRCCPFVPLCWEGLPGCHLGLQATILAPLQDPRLQRTQQGKAELGVGVGIQTQSHPERFGNLSE